MIERRQAPRGKTFLGGFIAFGHPGFPSECLVRNLSSDGAKVIFSDAIPVPSEIDLTIERQAQTRRARFVWRRGKEAGVAFLVGEKRAPIETVDLARKPKPAESDREILGRRIAEVIQVR